MVPTNGYIAALHKAAERDPKTNVEAGSKTETFVGHQAVHRQLALERHTVLHPHW